MNLGEECMNLELQQRETKHNRSRKHKKETVKTEEYINWNKEHYIIGNQWWSR